MQTALQGKIKEEKVNGNWSKQAKLTLPFNCSTTTQDKTKVRKARKARRYAGT